ncbi:hypothetical protein [Pseudidiomarina mangrovi]|uniref:hypothetical protein n=1 Tax=Pseudidiomarina mangrovi TaxID=2487133 RepID=UPI000FCA4A4B|nr:hypothetical protein [Pseudidiomarina mangrovi]
MMNLQHAFDQLVKQPNSNLSKNRLEQVALAVWYGDFVPNVNRYKGRQAAQAGFVLDKLSRFNCLTAEQKLRVREPLHSLKTEAAGFSSVQTKDSLAKMWGADYSLADAFTALLPLQTRHFQAQRAR